MLIVRRRLYSYKNVVSTLYLYNDSILLTKNFSLKILSKDYLTSRMSFFLMKNLITNFKIPKIKNYNINNKILLELKLSNTLQDYILRYIMFWIPYRMYISYAPLFILGEYHCLINFSKLPTNLRLKKLEEIVSGEAINFYLNISGFFSFLDYIYLINWLGFTNLKQACLESGLDYDYLLKIKKAKIINKLIKIEVL